MQSIQDQMKPNKVWLSSNAKPSARCSRHNELPARTNPVFLCAGCGTEFCPGCCGQTWIEFESAENRVLWYRCPYCPIGLAFVMLAKSDSLSAEIAPEGRIVRRGDYEAWQDGSGTCLLILDDKDRYAWVQKPDAVYLMATTAPAGTFLFPVQKGAYWLVDRNSGSIRETGLFLYLQLPHGYQEYQLPQGWPERGEKRCLKITSRILRDEEMKRFLTQKEGPPTAARGLDFRRPVWERPYAQAA
jgi:hypothetical protein